MALKIFTTGIEQYAPGGNATIKTMVIGGPGAGKTRWSSFWPKPFYLACEAGLASVADRRVPAVEIKNSQDMLEALTFLKQDQAKPYADRQFRTVIIDTLDAFQRKVKDEWLQKHPTEQSFKGFDAWGYLDAKMQMLLTRIMNLDVNVIILVHYTDKMVKDGDVETREIALQLDGKIKDSIFNDFDLVGWMGTYWEAENGQRVQKRGLTFKPTPDKPFLKDRLHVTPNWMEVQLDAERGQENYDDLFAAFSARMEGLGESEIIGEVPSLLEGQDDGLPTAGVVGPGITGALPPVDPKEIPLVQFDKPTLMKMCREEGITTLPDGTPIKGNTLKGELVLALEEHRKKGSEKPAETSAPSAPATPAPAPAPTGDAAPASAPVEDVAVTAAAPSSASIPDATPVTPVSPVKTVTTDEGEIDPATGEIVTPPASEEQALDSIESVLGGEVISVTEPVEEKKPEPTPAPAPAPAAGASGTCEQDGCDVDLSGEHVDLVRLSYIKFRTRLCNEHYKTRRAAG